MRQTAKYKQALNFCENVFGSRLPHDSHEDLYQTLNERASFWNPDRGLWEEAKTKADPPTQLIRVRVWADKNCVQAHANDIIYGLGNQGFQLQEHSEMYVCRPPKQLEARIYLTFKR